MDDDTVGVGRTGVVPDALYLICYWLGDDEVGQREICYNPPEDGLPAAYRHSKHYSLVDSTMASEEREKREVWIHTLGHNPDGAEIQLYVAVFPYEYDSTLRDLYDPRYAHPSDEDDAEVEVEN